MTLDELVTYLVANLPAQITAHSTTAVPLDAIPSTQIWPREFRDPNGSASIWLEPGEEESEILTCGTREVMLPISAYIFVQRDTEAQLRLKAYAYRDALQDCLAAHPDFVQVLKRDYFDGVEGINGVKAAKLDLEFRYEETL